MSREHKYRTWSEKLNKMVFFTLHELLLCYNNEDDYCRLADTDLFNIQQDIDADEAMQFTGRVDRNDKEVYEGDIVTYQLYEDTQRYTGVVEYNVGASAFRVNIVTNLSSTMYVEVVGNIHESPHLTNGAQTKEQEG